jgi:F5/8 type C domain
MGSPQRRPARFLTKTLLHDRHQEMTERPRVRKRSLAADTATVGRAADEIDIACCATIAYSSEDAAHPVENILDGQSGPGGTRWVSARPDTAEHIVVEFDQPRAISRLVYEVHETVRERTQEVRLEASDDGGRTYRQILVQEYNFSPRGATFQREDQRVDLRQVTHLRLTVVPNKSGSGPATLSTLRLFA